MKKIRLISLITVLLLSSCITSHTGTVSGGPLLNGNDKYNDIAQGTSLSVFVFGIGDLKKHQLVQNAKTDLYSRRPLKRGEYYSNFTTDIDKKLIFFIAQRISVTVSADVLVTGDTSSFGFGNNFSKKITPFIPVKNRGALSSEYNGNAILKGDSVYYSYNSKNYNLYVVSSLDKESTVLLSVDPFYKSILVSLERNYFFITKETDKVIKVNDNIKFEVLDSYTGGFVNEEGQVMGYAAKNALVKTKSGFHIIPEDKLKK